jgi:hypothetical protein
VRREMDGIGAPDPLEAPGFPFIVGIEEGGQRMAGTPDSMIASLPQASARKRNDNNLISIPAGLNGTADGPRDQVDAIVRGNDDGNSIRAHVRNCGVACLRISR